MDLFVVHDFTVGSPFIWCTGRSGALGENCGVR